MKLTILFIAAYCSVASAQIPNSGFEVWTSMGNYNSPDQWATLNAMTDFDGIYTCTKGTPGNPGVSYLMLRSQTITGLGVVPGIAATGTIDTNDYSIDGGFLFTLRPQNLTGNWQFMSASGVDFGFIAVYLTRWDTVMNTRDTVAKTITSLTGMVMSWSSFTLALTYESGSFPDSAQIVLSASGLTPYDSDYLYIDNLGFSGSVAGMEDNSFVNHLVLFPNPSSGYLNISYQNLSGGHVQIELMDVLGKKISTLYSGKDAKGFVQKSFDVRNTPKGVYWIRISEGGIALSGKIIKL